MISMMGKGSYPSINQTDVASIQIPLPPLSIQEEIVTEIEGYQKIIDGAKAVVENYKPKIDIDSDWEMVKLGNICSIGDGNYSSKYPKASEFVEKGIPFLTATNLKNGTVVKNGIRYISKEQHLQLTKGHVLKNDLVIVVRGSSTGNNSIVPSEYEGANLNSQLVFLRVSDKRIDSRYLFAVFNTHNVQKIVLNAISGSAQPQLPNGVLLSIKIPLASIETQHQIVTQIEKEQALVNASKQLIEIFEQKIKDRIAKVWGADKKEAVVYEENDMVSMAAEE
jgi:type I restriction enzyme M protein